MHNRWHPDLEPIAEVGVDEEVRLETADGVAGQLTRASSHADAGALDLGLAHPLTGPLFVRDAEPGDVLEVEFLEYETADFGVTAVIPGFGYLADLFPDPYLVKWEIAGGLARAPGLPGVAVPEEPFAGVVGVAPSHAQLEEFRAREEALSVRRTEALARATEPDAPPERRRPSLVPADALAACRELEDSLEALLARRAATWTSASSSRGAVSGSRSPCRVRSSRPATCTSPRATARSAAPRSRSQAP